AIAFVTNALARTLAACQTVPYTGKPEGLMLFSILLALIQTNQPAHEEIVIHHRKVAQFMRSGWLLVTQFQVAPGNIKVSTDTAKNAIVLDGPSGILRAIRDAITFFDVAPRIIKLTLQSSAPQYG